MRGMWKWVVLGLGCFGCAAPSGVPGPAEAAIVNGVASGEDAVVAIFSFQSGGLCSGSVIAPRAVLTAKHCVQRPGQSEPDNPKGFIIGIGTLAERPTAVYRAQEIRTTPGVYTTGGQFGLDGALVGQDVAVMILTTPVLGVTPLKVRRDAPTDQVGPPLRVIGFGQTPAGETGVKYETTTNAYDIDEKVIYTEASTCQGDSGGPLMQADTNEIIGVTSFGSGACGWGFAAAQLVAPYMDLIDQAVDDSGACLNESDEVCDGIDNDCDDEVDEGCLPLGEACASDDQCVGGACLDTPKGKLCSATCDPLNPGGGCGDGLYCARTSGCDGVCVPTSGGDGSKGLGASCGDDAECASLLCVDPGDGVARCLSPCKGDAGLCFAGDACVAAPGECGACVDAGAISSPLGLGEPCGEAADCRSGLCRVDDPSPYCSRTCTDDTGCGGAFHCRGGECVRGTRSGVGGICELQGDCRDMTLCATAGDLSWCTSTCEADMDCPDMFACLPAGDVQVCAPELKLLGERCDGPNECISGLCEATSGGSRCTRLCTAAAPCETGFECAAMGDGETGLCVRAGDTLGGGGGGRGCALVAPGGAPSWLPLAGVLLAWFGARRRRR